MTLTPAQIMFNLDKVHIIIDEIIQNGHIVETNKNRILAPLLALDKMAEAHWAVVWTIDLNIASLYLSNYDVFKSTGSAIKAISIMK